MTFGVVAGGMLAGADAARAALVVDVTESGGPTIPILDNGPLDTNSSLGAVNANTSLLNTLLLDFNVSSLGATSNALTGTPFSDNPAFISQTGAVTRSTPAGTSSITITAYDTNYLFPASNPKQMTTAASDTFTFTSSGSTRSFQSSFDPTNSDPPGPGINSPLLVFVPPTGVGPFGTSNPGVTTALGTQPLPFGLNNTTVITLGPTPFGSAPSDQFTGATTVTPEPTAGLLMLVGAGILGMRRRRHR